MTLPTLPVLALPHPLVLLPTARITLPVHRLTGEALLNLVQESEAQPVIAAVPLVSPEAPIYGWGVAARITRLIKPPSRNPKQPFLLSLHGITRIRIFEAANSESQDQVVSVSPDGGLQERKVEYAPPDGVPSMEWVVKFKTAALRLLDHLARDTTQQTKRDTYNKVASMLEEMSDQRAPWMADVMVASVNGDYADKLDFLSATDADERLARATALFVKQASISEVSKKIAQSVDESLSKQQKEFFLRQQLAAIQRELANLSRPSHNNSSNNGNPNPTSNSNNIHVGGSSPLNGANLGPVNELDDDEQAEVDDLAEVKAKILAMAVGSEERKMGAREFKRLKRIPQGSVEHGVIRNYLEWLTSIPWPSSSTTPTTSQTLTSLRSPTFLPTARAQLDADHFGLEKIKKRLIEYLAVVRLKELQHEREVLKQSKLQAMVEEKKAQEERAKKVIEIRDTDPMGAHIDAMFPGAGATPLQVVPKRSVGEGGKVVKKGVKGPILLFVGPPGTGKTSLGQSIAKALDRPFQRISLGGVRDEAEIRGHRRTYVASGPGMIVQALRKAGRPDPVILLDEVDKVSHSNFHGDPAAALLEVLDPEQNHTFNDHYINVPIDLSQVLFICTSNTLETISAPLLDRCEVIQLSGYTYNEKMHIARRYLLPKQLEANGLTKDHLTITEPALLDIATMYTREAGVRSLERAIGAVVRYKAVEWAELDDGGSAEVAVPATTGSTTTSATTTNSALTRLDPAKKPFKRTVDETELEKILGIPRYDLATERDLESRRGLVYGLVVSSLGEGSIMPVETMFVPGGSGKLKLTGSLGDVIKESAEIALSWVKRRASELGVVGGAGSTTSHSANAGGSGSERQIVHRGNVDPLKNVSLDGDGVGGAVDVHCHLPSGAVRKDGPSAGVAMVCAFVSLLTGNCVPSGVCMTGEITLRGRVGPVGGIKEKVLGAHRANMKKVILPWANRKDVEYDVPIEVKTAMQFVFVRTVEEALEAAFGKGVLGWRNGVVLMESRL